MGLLSISKRKKYFQELGYGEYNFENIKKLQKDYFIRSRDIDGIYGNDTDILLRHVYNCSKAKNFTPEEFRCECGGRFCTGYPTFIRANMVMFMQEVRDYYDKPVTITSGLRCKKFNATLRGASPVSKHLEGKACDYYIQGISNTKNGRNAIINTVKHFPNHQYSYGNTPNMGNAIHSQVTT